MTVYVRRKKVREKGCLLFLLLERNLMLHHRHPIRMQGNTSQSIMIADNPSLTLYSSVEDCAGVRCKHEKQSVLCR